MPASFQVEDKLKKPGFFKKIFLLTDLNVELVLEMLFLMLSNANIQFIKKKLIWKSYTTTKVLPTTKYIDLINKKEFAKTVLGKNIKAFVVLVILFNFGKLIMLIYLAKKIQITLLIAKKVKILIKYLDFSEIFLEKKT